MTDHQPAIAKLADLDTHLAATQARLEAMAQDANGANAIAAAANRAFIRDTLASVVEQRSEIARQIKSLRPAAE